MCRRGLADILRAMEQTARPLPASPTLARPLAIVAAFLGALGCALILMSSGPAGGRTFMVGATLFVPGLPLAIVAVVIGLVKPPRVLLLPFIALAINLVPVALFFFLLSVVAGMQH